MFQTLHLMFMEQLNAFLKSESTLYARVAKEAGV